MRTKSNILTKIKLTATVIVSLYVLLGFFLIPYIVKSQAIKAVDASLNAQLTIEKVYFNPIIFTFELHNVALNKEKKPLISFEKLALDFDLARTILNQYIHFKNLELEKPFIDIQVDKNKQMNLLALLPKTDETKKEAPKVTQTNEKSELIKVQLDKLNINQAHILYANEALNKPFKTDIKNFNIELRDINTRKKDVTAHTFHAEIDNQALLKGEGGIYLNPFKAYGTIDLQKFSPISVWESIKQNETIDFNKKLLVDMHIGYTISSADALLVQLNDSMLELKNFSLSQNKQKMVELNQLKLDKLNLTYPAKKETQALKTDFSVFINQGEIATKTDVELEPLDIKSNFKVTQLPLDILNHILSQYLHLKIDSAYLQSQGNLHVDAKNSIDFSSDTQLDQIKLTQDKMKLVTMQSLKLNNIGFNSQKNALNIQSIDFEKPYSYVHINKKSELNLAKLAKTQPKKSAEVQKEKEKTSTAPMHITLGMIKIKNGSMTFEDETLPIPFKIENKKLNGHFSHFNTKGTKPSTLKLEGQVGKYGYVLIKGLTTHNDIKNSTDVKLDFSNISIHDLTPYSGKFVGRKIDEGKLSLDLNYTIKNAQLDANNNIVIEKIKLGEKIESKDAMNLPLDLAIAILEDSNGIIDLSLPIKGDLDNPEFSIAPIVWKAFTNLIAKALTAPFSLLGALFGFDEDEINSIVFGYGNYKITPVQKEPLDKIAQILQKRGKLAMKLEPLYNSTHDLYALQTLSFDKKINEKLKKVDEEDYQEEYMDLLEEWYESYDLDTDDLKERLTKEKELDMIAYENSIKDTLIKKEVIPTETLEKLAQQRVNNIKEYLVKTKKINAAQIIIDEKIQTVQGDDKSIELKLSVANIK